MRAGTQLYYDFDLYVTHPDKALTPVAAARAFAYGAGFGRVLRKHISVIPKSTVLRFFIRPIGGIVLSLPRGNLLHSRYYLQTFFGRLSGLLTRTATQPSTSFVTSYSGTG